MIIEIVLATAFLWLIIQSYRLSQLYELAISREDLRDYVSKDNLHDLSEELKKEIKMLREYLDVEEDTILVKGEKIRGYHWLGGETREPYIKKILVKKKK